MTSRVLSTLVPMWSMCPARISWATRTLTFRHPNGTHYTLSPSADGVLVEPRAARWAGPTSSTRVSRTTCVTARGLSWVCWLDLLAFLVQRKTLGIIEVHTPGTRCAWACKPEGRA